MIHRSSKVAFALALAVLAAGCHHNKVNNPIANVDSKQPDKVLFDRAMDAMKHGKYDVARITLQTLINTYPDSEYIARAKLAVGDSWYAEGSTAAYQQAEVEYKDFITFFPNLPEAAEAQLKIANMHYKQMEKPDRDYTHAMRAEDEYRQLIQQFPDSKLVPEAKQHLREVQEVLAERQYRVGRFYYLRESYPAAIARLKTLTDTYPLYSQADDALMMLARSYEAEGALIKNSRLQEATKVKMIRDYQNQAAEDYARIIERYPLSDRADDARSRLKDLGKPVPTPTPEAIAAYKNEEASRSEMGRFGKVMANFRKAPDDLARASKVGEPTLVDPQPTNAPQIIRSAQNAALGMNEGGGNAVTVDKATPDQTKSDPIPRSDSGSAAPAESAPASSDASSSSSSAAAPAAKASAANAPAGNEPSIGELTPNMGTSAATANGAAAADNSNAGQTSSSGTSSSKASDSGTSSPAPAPPQVNEIQNDTSSANASNGAVNAGSNDDTNSSSSKKKKKKGLKKLF
ncbi:MAG TPA: outer membrane protein assembly factor BamD [Terriglobales bacterium]|nr:outer membrane protein assembly factor BamD [Terriglobales bacterium]